jgi:dTDP-glucose pyrophosphorylase
MDRLQELADSKGHSMTKLIELGLKDLFSKESKDIDMLRKLLEPFFVVSLSGLPDERAFFGMLYRLSKTYPDESSMSFWGNNVYMLKEDLSNEDVFNPKPFPEMYWKCMIKMGALPKDTIIVEDSHIGRQGALDSGAHLLAVENAKEVNSEYMMQRIYDLMNTVEGTSKKSLPWRDKKLNVLIPMAGAGSRFAQAGYTFPKPLIEVRGKPMIQVVVENLNIEANYIFLVQKDHYETYNLKYLLNLIAPGCKIVQVDGITEGAACTTLLAKEHIDNDAPLVMANSDQFVEWNSNECMYAFSADSIDGGILTFKATHPKWSYAKLNEDGFVSEVAEKKVISDEATVGIYYWRHGSDYVKYAEQMIDKNIRTNGEFYTCPVFNEAISDGKKIRVKNIEKMWGIGTPEDLNYFLDNHKE